MIITKYDKVSGRFDATLQGDAQSIFRQVQPGEAFLEGEYDTETQYVLDGSVMARPIIGGPRAWSILANDYETARVQGLPPGTRVHVSRMDVPRSHAERDNLATLIDDGEFEWSTTQPGIYEVAIFPPFPYVPFKGEITANAF